MIWQITDLREIDKSRYFAITEFNNCLSFDHQVCFLNEYLWEGKRSAIFRARVIAGRRKVLFSFRHEQKFCSQTLNQTQLDKIVREQTVICRQLFKGHVVGFRPMKRKKNLPLMITIIIIIHCTHYLSSHSLRAYS